ncbi:hypothetical protein O5560_26665, partial [Escherichia coli]|nr:hypothetical protein [Escherichia coli]
KLGALDYLFVSSKPFAEKYFPNGVNPGTSGVRPLCDDESDSPQAITRDYTLDIHDENGKAPLLSVFGGAATRAAICLSSSGLLTARLLPPEAC